jgi:type II secretory pathway component PulF
LVALLTHRRRLSFLQQLHALIKSGTGLPTAFAELSRYVPAREREAIARAAERVAAGETLARAVRDDRSHFDDVTLELLAAAEEAGALESMLGRAIAQAEEAQKLRWQAVMIALYPTYLLVGLILFGPLLDMPAAISAAGGATNTAADAYVHGFERNVLVISLSLGTLFCWPLIVAALGIETRWDAFRQRLPILGGLYRSLYRTRFANALSTALSAGLGAHRILALACRTMQSPSLEKRAGLASEVIQRGGTFADAIATFELFESHDLGQLSVAERTGDLDQVSARLANQHWEAAVRRMRIATFFVAGLVVAALLVAILVKLIGVLLGPVSDYYNLKIPE